MNHWRTDKLDMSSSNNQFNGTGRGLALRETANNTDQKRVQMVNGERQQTTAFNESQPPGRV